MGAVCAVMPSEHVATASRKTVIFFILLCFIDLSDLMLQNYNRQMALNNYIVANYGTLVRSEVAYYCLWRPHIAPGYGGLVVVKVKGEPDVT